MQDPRFISIEDYRYDLPEALIATHPLPERDQSRLLFWDKGIISDRRFRELPDLLQGNTLVFNNTRVFEARMQFRTDSGAAVEIFLLEPEDRKDPLIALTSKGNVRWRCMVGRAGKWKQPQLQLHADGITLTVEKLLQEQGTFILQFDWQPEKTFAEVIHVFGQVPLPPYLNRKPEKEDGQRYQTVYARHTGSVAAPTAGLHFTEAVEQDLDQKGFRREYLTLHVGAGTFKPVTAEKLEGHDMHSELIDVTCEVLERLSEKKPEEITAVGTTTLRTLESLYWLAHMIQSHPEMDVSKTEIDQWFPYQTKTDMPYREALRIILDKSRTDSNNRVMFRSRLLIAPGYRIRSCGGLITNFHQPASTLLLLIASVTHGAWKDIYIHALDKKYRFLSYGDSSYLRF